MKKTQNERKKIHKIKRKQLKNIKVYICLAIWVICYDYWKIYTYWRMIEDTGAPRITVAEPSMLQDKYDYRPPIRGEYAKKTEECGMGFLSTNTLRQKQDQKIYEYFFKNQTVEPRYVEVGAWNGVRNSMLRYFDLCLGWEGLIIEAHPRIYEELVKNRPSAHKLRFSPTCSTKGEYLDFYAGPGMFSGLVNVSLGYAESPEIPIEKVICGSLGVALQSIFGNKRISLFQMHIENAELMALQTINFDLVQIDIMVINLKGLHCQGPCDKRRDVRKLLRINGYQLYEGLIYKCDVYVHRNKLLEMDDEQLNNFLKV